MAFKIVGSNTGAERDAAEQLARTFSSHMCPSDSLLIVVGMKCVGQKYQDIDLLLGTYGRGLEIPVTKTYPSFRLVNLALIVEAKDSLPSDIQIDADSVVKVRYGTHWHDANNQLRGQIHSVRKHLSNRGFRDTPFFGTMLWLRGVPPTARC